MGAYPLYSTGFGFVSASQLIRDIALIIFGIILSQSIPARRVYVEPGRPYRRQPIPMCAIAKIKRLHPNGSENVEVQRKWEELQATRQGEL